MSDQPWCPHCGSTRIQGTAPDNLESTTAVSKTATCADCEDTFVIEYEAAYIAYPDESSGEWQREPIGATSDT